MSPRPWVLGVGWWGFGRLGRLGGQDWLQNVFRHKNLDPFRGKLDGGLLSS